MPSASLLHRGPQILVAASLSVALSAVSDGSIAALSPAVNRPAAGLSEIPDARIVTAVHTAPAARLRPAGVEDRPARGLRFDGLHSAPECTGGWRIEGAGEGFCSHGPDASPAGVDVR
jgi:hypothetical protein